MPNSGRVDHVVHRYRWPKVSALSFTFFIRLFALRDLYWQVNRFGGRKAIVTEYTNKELGAYINKRRYRLNRKPDRKTRYYNQLADVDVRGTEC